MPPKGLYRIPQHHLTGQGAQMKRPSYNSMDFAEEEPAPITTNDGATDEVADEEKARLKQEKVERKESRRLRRLSKAKTTEEQEKLQEKQKIPPVDVTSTATPAATNTSMPLKNGRYGPRGPYKKKEIGPDGTPVSTVKKRKRESEAPVAMPAVVPTEPPKKKPGRPKGSGKKDVVASIETANKVVKPGESKAKKQKLEKAPAASNLVNASKVIKTPVPVPTVASASSSRPRQTPVPLPQKTPVPLPQKTPVPVPQKTPVPLPPKSPRTLKDSMSESLAKQNMSASAQSEVLVAETPLSQMSRTPTTVPRASAIPFSLAPTSSTAAKASKKSKKAPAADDSFPEIPLLAVAKLAKADKHVVGSQGSVNPLTNSQIESFTSANPMNFKHPLREDLKPRPRSRRAASEAMSTTSSAWSSASSNRSIMEMFPRPNKPYTRRSEERSSYDNKKRKHAEKHTEANFAIFATTFATSQHTINFTDETEYMEENDEWLSDSEAAGPLPCLGTTTGCSPEGEQLLKLQRADETASPALKVVATNAAQVEKVATDTQRVATACTFLRYSIMTRVPVPLGMLQGVWTLYCPKYTKTHIDSHGFGQRTLTISPVLSPSATTSGAHTALVRIPPRSIKYATHAFQVPPHASFRTVMVKTADNAHKFFFMFLGNGYLKMRVHVHLLTAGKTAAEAKAARTGRQARAQKESEVVWEFLGVHEEAVVWEPVMTELDMLEKEGRRLTAKYDGP